MRHASFKSDAHKPALHKLRLVHPRSTIICFVEGHEVCIRVREANPNVQLLMEVEVFKLSKVKTYGKKKTVRVATYSTDYKTFLRYARKFYENYDHTICHTYLGNATNKRRYYVNPKDKVQWMLGVFKRLLPALEPCALEYDLLDFIDFSRHYIVDHYKPIPYIEPTVDNLCKYWLDDSKYTVNQKAKLIRAFEIAKSRNFNLRADDFVCNSFIKLESYDEPKIARVINSRSDVFKSTYAMYVKAIEDQIYDDHFIKHHTPDWTANRLIDMSSKFTTLLETDYSSFESCFGNEIYKHIEGFFFSYMLHNNPHLENIISRTWQKNTIRRGDCSFSFHGTRMSGDMWTSLGNGLMNKLIMEYTMSLEQNEQNFDYLVEGDDGFLALERPVSLRHITKIGFLLKSEYVDELNKCSFCGIKTLNGHTLGDLHKVLSVYNFTMDPGCVRGSQKRLTMMKKAKAMSFNVLYGHVEGFREILLKDMRVTDAIPSVSYYDRWEYENYGISDAIVPQSYIPDVTYNDVYGVSIRMLHAFGQGYSIYLGR
ncbi:hypothetical protein 2 [Human tombus-like virus]